MNCMNKSYRALPSLDTAACKCKYTTAPWPSRSCEKVGLGQRKTTGGGTSYEQTSYVSFWRTYYMPITVKSTKIQEKAKLVAPASNQILQNNGNTHRKS